MFDSQQQKNSVFMKCVVNVQQTNEWKKASKPACGAPFFSSSYLDDYDDDGDDGDEEVVENKNEQHRRQRKEKSTQETYRNSTHSEPVHCFSSLALCLLSSTDRCSDREKVEKKRKHTSAQCT